jgi:hypothetical protein
MSAIAETPTSTPRLFKNPAIVEATLMTLLARVQALEAQIQYDSTATSNTSTLSSSEHFENQTAAKPVPSETKVVEVLDENEVTKTATEISNSKTEDSKYVEVADKILNIVASYGTHEKEYPEEPCQAKETFRPIVLECIKKGTTVKLVLPAFPFKSPNRHDKVLGALPDLGEEIALAKLQSLCDNIRDVYEHGADCYITSDGLVYNGKVFSPLEDTIWLIV